MLGLKRIRLGIIIGLLTFAAGSAFAADDETQLSQQLDACRKDALDSRQAVFDADDLLNEAHAQKLIIFPAGDFTSVADPQSYARFLLLQWASHKITKDDLRKGLQNIDKWSKLTVQGLAGLKADAIKNRDEIEGQCGALAQRLKMAQNAANAPPPPAGQTARGWVSRGPGDCSGQDEGSSSGSVPDSGRCTSANAGKAAVCWDGKTYVNHYGETHGAPAYPWCTYKSTNSCGGGSNAGMLYVCRP